MLCETHVYTCVARWFRVWFCANMCSRRYSDTSPLGECHHPASECFLNFIVMDNEFIWKLVYCWIAEDVFTRDRTPNDSVTYSCCGILSFHLYNIKDLLYSRNIYNICPFYFFTFFFILLTSQLLGVSVNSSFHCFLGGLDSRTHSTLF